MKKLMIALAVLAMVAGSIAVAATYTNSLGQVVTYTVGDLGTEVTGVTQPSGGSARARTFANLPGQQISEATTVVATAFTPRDIGDFLIGLVSNVVYMSTGRTTNDWVQLEP